MDSRVLRSLGRFTSYIKLPAAYTRGQAGQLWMLADMVKVLEEWKVRREEGIGQ